VTREQAFQLISEERNYQDKTYTPDKTLESGLTRLERDKEVTPHIVLLESYVEKAREAWVPGGGQKASLQQIAKVAAIAVRALERAAGADALLTEGLR
jgi:hypothetical protein